MTGTFITFEGIDGSGKTTQSQFLRDDLTAAGQKVTLVREPGSTPIGERMRELLQRQNAAESPRAQLMLFLASRAELASTIIRPALERGETVICDRHGDSSVAYQGYGEFMGQERGLIEHGDRGQGRGRDNYDQGRELQEHVDAIKAFNRYATGGLRPLVTILVDIDVKTANTRILQRGGQAGDARTGFEQREINFHERVRRGYLALAAAEPERWRVFDGTKPADVLRAEISAAVSERIAKE